MTTAVLEAEELTKAFGGGRSLLGAPKPVIHAVQDVSLTLNEGETFGVVGESGCGKSTLARMLVGLSTPTRGTIRIAGKPFDRHLLGATAQYVFQDPVSSLNPRHTVRRILEAPLIHLKRLGRDARAARINYLMDAVGLRPDFLERYPHEFSGGQAQRIGIARALAAEARIIVLDEPVSALDVSVQAQILNLLADLKARFGLTYLFISHDLAVVEAVADRVAVMYFGRIVEEAPADRLFAHPHHPYTRLLLDSAPAITGKRIDAGEQPAELPDPLAPPPGCAFAERCPHARADCRARRPPLAPMGPYHSAACLYPLNATD